MQRDVALNTKIEYCSNILMKYLRFLMKLYYKFSNLIVFSVIALNAYASNTNIVDIDRSTTTARTTTMIQSEALQTVFAPALFSNLAEFLDTKDLFNFRETSKSNKISAHFSLKLNNFSSYTKPLPIFMEDLLKKLCSEIYLETTQEVPIMLLHMMNNSHFLSHLFWNHIIENRSWTYKAENIDTTDLQNSIEKTYEEHTEDYVTFDDGHANGIRPNHKYTIVTKNNLNDETQRRQIYTWFSESRNLELVLCFEQEEIATLDFNIIPQLIGRYNQPISVVKKMSITGQNLKFIGNEFLNFVEGLEILTLPYGITRIGENFLGDPLGLKVLTLPDTVESIGECLVCCYWPWHDIKASARVKNLLIQSNARVIFESRAAER